MTADKTFDKILNTGAKIKIARLFILKGKNFMATGRHIAKLTAFTAPAAHAALKDLLNKGILIRHIIGKQHIYSLNENSRTVKEIIMPLFQKEIPAREENRGYATLQEKEFVNLLHEKAFMALKEAVRGVVEQHKQTGRPLAIWRNGKVVKVSASEVLRKHK